MLSLYVPGLDTTDPTFLYYLCAVVAVLTTVVLSRIGRLQLGRNLAAVKESEFAARSVGVDVTRTKLTAFVIAGLCAGVSGFLVAHVEQSVNPAGYDLFDSVYILVGVILGGSGSAVGAWLGAAYISLVPALFAAWEVVRRFGDPPAPEVLPIVLASLGAVVVNGVCAWLLIRVRHHGGSLSRAAFLSARNDVLVNVAVITMGLVTAWTGSGWPDLVLGCGIILLAGHSAYEVWEVSEEERLAARAVAGEEIGCGAVVRQAGDPARAGRRSVR